MSRAWSARCTKARPARGAMPGSRSSTWASISARRPARSSRAASAKAGTGASGSSPAASPCSSASLQFKMTQKYLGTAGLRAARCRPSSASASWTLVAAVVVAVLIGAVLAVHARERAVGNFAGAGTVRRAGRDRGRLLRLHAVVRRPRPPSRRNASASSSSSSCARRCSGAASSSRRTTFNTFALDYTDRSWLGGMFPENVHPGLVVPVDQPGLHHPLRAVLRVDLGVRWARATSTRRRRSRWAWASILLGFGFLIMMWAAQLVVSSGGKVGPTWLLLAYMIHTFGELCLSPVGPVERHQARAGQVRQQPHGHVVPRQRHRQHRRRPGRRPLRLAQGRRAASPLPRHDADRRRRRRVHHAASRARCAAGSETANEPTNTSRSPHCTRRGRHALRLPSQAARAACPAAAEVGATPPPKIEQRRTRSSRRSTRTSSTSNREGNAAGWTQATDITVDTQYLNARVTDRYLEYFSRKAGEAKAYDGQKLDAIHRALADAAQAGR